jgi:hypothetical protein
MRTPREFPIRTTAAFIDCSNHKVLTRSQAAFQFRSRSEDNSRSLRDTSQRHQRGKLHSWRLEVTQGFGVFGFGRGFDSPRLHSSRARKPNTIGTAVFGGFQEGSGETAFRRHALREDVRRNRTDRSHLRHAAVHEELCSRDVAAVVGREEDDQLRDFVAGLPNRPTGTALATILARCWPVSDDASSSFSPGVSRRRTI